MLESFVSCRIACYSEKYCRNEKGKITGKSIKDAIKGENRDKIDFQHNLSGSYFSYNDAVKSRCHSLNIRFNQDRSVCVIPVK